MRNKKKIFINIVLLLFILVIFFLFSEIILRTLGMSCSIVDKDNEAPFLVSSEGYHYMKPNYDGKFKCIAFDIDVKTNSYGFRDEEFNIKEGGIILFGDSIAFGYGIQQDETYEQILEDNLLSKGYGDVYNLGVPGYGLDEYNWLYDKYSGKLRHKLVILTIYEGNDFQESCNLIDRSEFVANEREGFGFFKDSLKKSYTFKFLYPLTKNIVNVGETAVSSGQFFIVDEPEDVKNCNKEFKEKLVELRDKIMGNDKDLVVLILPSKAVFLESSDLKIDYEKRLKTLLNFCSELNLNCVNFKDYINNPDEIYQKDSGHPNKEGHIKIAELLYNYVVKEE